MAMSFFKSLFGIKKSLEERFWEWFVKNQGLIANIKDDDERDFVFFLLSTEIDKVNPDLCFEFGPLSGERVNEFIISADGIKSVFPAVEALYAAAPDLPDWKIIKYRPRMNFKEYEIQMCNKSISPEDVFFRLFPDRHKVGIVLMIDGYSQKEHEVYMGIGFLFLDAAIGEFDVATKVGLIEFTSCESEWFNEESEPLYKLPELFDQYYQSRSQ